MAGTLHSLSRVGKKNCVPATIIIDCPLRVATWQDKTKLLWQPLDPPAHFSVTVCDNPCRSQQACDSFF